MDKIPLFAAALGLVAGAASLPAEALVCNIVFDRNDQVIYRNVTPPLDLSDGGSRARAAMRQRGEYLMVIDTDRCAPVAPRTDKSSAASVEDIVAGMRPYMGRGGGQPTAGGAAAGGSGSAVRTAPPAAATTSRGASTRAY
ncbi:MAG: hypothetical protein ABI541_06195 [Betaproteobacteria bacterium]